MSGPSAEHGVSPTGRSLARDPHKEETCCGKWSRKQQVFPKPTNLLVVAAMGLVRADLHLVAGWPPFIWSEVVVAVAYCRSSSWGFVRAFVPGKRLPSAQLPQPLERPYSLDAVLPVVLCMIPQSTVCDESPIYVHVFRDSLQSLMLHQQSF